MGNTPLEHFDAVERAQIKRTGDAGGNSRSAPTRSVYTPRTTHHVSILAQPSAPTSNAGERALTPCSRVPDRMPNIRAPRHYFAASVRARVKRTGEAGGDSPCAARTHPSYMPGATRHVSIMAPLSAPETNAPGRDWELTSPYSHAAIVHAGGKTPGQNFGPAERASNRHGRWELTYLHCSRRPFYLPKAHPTTSEMVPS